jgi:protein-tyrosine sulfotransferase
MVATLQTAREPEFAVIVGAARSGTTLLRSLLDAHPEIGCPAEAGLPALMSHARRVWATVCSSGDPAAADPQTALQADDLPAAVMPLPPRAEQEVRRLALAVMESYCRPAGKRIYCDKSLDNAQHLPTIFHVFPRTKCILLVRHVMDTIASGLEASPWGFNAFGYAPFVHASPENTVMALARYWEMQVTLALKWQTANPGTCIRLRYEDLVHHPDTTLSALFDFLSVRCDLTTLGRAFGQFNPASGPGDYKLPFTSRITTASVERGKQVPVALIPPSLRERLTQLLEQLGYSALTDSWNAEPRGGTSPSTSARTELARLMAWTPDGDWQFDVESIAIVADDDPGLRWIVEPRAGTVRQGDGEAEVVLTGASEDLACLIKGDENPGVLLRAGRVRFVSAEQGPEPLLQSPRLISSLVKRFAGNNQQSADRTRPS